MRALDPRRSGTLSRRGTPGALAPATPRARAVEPALPDELWELKVRHRRRPERARVIVVGGGVAGLVAARRLEAAEVDVRVLEANDRLGGRVWTRPLGDGVLAEAGAELLEGGHHALFRLLKELRLPTVRVLRGGFRFWATPPAAGRRDGSRKMTVDFRRLVARLTQAGGAFEASNRTWASQAASQLARISLGTWIRRERLAASLREQLRSLVRGLMLGDPRRLSLLQVVHELTGDEEAGPRGEFHRIVGGNARLPESLVAALRRPPELRHVVERITQGPSGVVVDARHGRARVSWRADAAVVALPVAPLRRVRFVPGLPVPHRAALDRLGTGPVTKTVLHLAHRGRERTGFAYATASPLGSFWDAGDGQRGAPAVLSVLAGGDLSRPQARRAEPARVAWVAAHQPLVPADRVHAGLSVSWEHERWAGGGYATFDVGFPAALRSALAAPLSRIAFAGEHTSMEHQGYVNGAVESGLRAAEELLASPGLSRRR